ncbi:MAG TPA: PLP-dependent aminotransferase family protein, partial [Negativicutes bacterium]|nr:PLP-dependent aminotransferase family protein [Negativicutes bacterium]
EALEELKAQGLIEGKFGQGTKIINNTWSLLLAAPPPNWQSYINAGIHKANFPTIQIINKLEFAAGITRLSTGEVSPELFPGEMMRTVLRKISDRVSSLNYLQPLGLPELRQTLSQYLTKHGIHVPPSCLLIVSGSLQALQLISVGMLQPGSTVFVEIPSYLKSLRIFQSAGMKLAGVPMDRRGILPQLIANNKPLNDTALLYTIPTFHNPTGTVMSTERRAALLDWCQSNRLPIIEDDAYRELWIDEIPPLPLKAKDQAGMVLYMGSVSKSLAPGLRLGWLAGPESVVERLGDIKMQTDYGASSLSQWALTEWIQSGLYHEHLAILRNHLRIRRDTVLHTLENYYQDIASWNIPTGSFYIWLKLNKNISIDNLFATALNEKLLINPGSIYDFSKNQYIRISYAYDTLDALNKGLRRLAQLIRTMSK